MKKGFTLIELIVVIAIIAILAAIIAPNAFKAIDKAKVAHIVADLKTIKVASMSYYTDTGQWPPDLVIRDNNSYFFSDSGLAGWDGPYLEKVPLSPLPRPTTCLLGCGNCGWYYIYGASADYSSIFDFNHDGTDDITNGISICIHNFQSDNSVFKIDIIFDGEKGTGLWVSGKEGKGGVLNTVYGDICVGPVALYIGQR